MTKNLDKYIQGSIFEDDYLIRTLGNLANSSEIALTEIVANAWDAGSTNVDILIPEKTGQIMSIVDNGTGLTKDEFYNRWMKLGYNRLKNQGKQVEFPPGIDYQRVAYGRNGVGRHGMLCFNNVYKVITAKNGEESTFEITTATENEPFVIATQSFAKSKQVGTRLEVIVQKNLPNPDRILEVLSTRFLHDPKFKLTINRKTVELEELKGFVDSKEIDHNGIKLKVILVDSMKTRNSTMYQGIAIWQSSRLVGDPSWILGGTMMVLDGRTKLAKRYTVVVQTEDLADFILEDWTGFKKDDTLLEIFEKVSESIHEMFSQIAKENIEETKSQIKSDYADQYGELSPLGKYEFNEAVEQLAIANPTATADAIALAVQTILNLEKTRSGAQLLAKLGSLSDEDIDGLNQILDKWTVKDALTVLDEIDNRLSVIEAIRKLSKDKTVDELHVLHPLVTNARWVFGPEFDSPEYASNNQLQRTVEKVFGEKVDKNAFNNSRKRPDIVVMGNSTFSITGTEEFDSQTSITHVNRVLLIELKKGGFELTREERNQATGYVEDFVGCGTLLKSPYIHAFVVGDSFKENMQPIQAVINENQVELGKVHVCLFSQLVDTAERRLFGLRKRLNERYDDVPGIELISRNGKQMKIA